jgi:hypothetical protein
MNPAQILNDLLGKHALVVLFVYPAACKGLDDFPPNNPLRLNLGYALKPDMGIQTDESGVSFVGSFGGVRRTVVVPWGGLLFAGSEAHFAECVKASLAIQKERSQAAVPKAEPGSNVVHVDFRKKTP